MMKPFSFLLVLVLLCAACEKKESAQKSDPASPGGGASKPVSSNSGSTAFNYPIGNYDWIGQYNGQIYATDLAFGNVLIRIDVASRKLTMIKKIQSANNFQSIAHSMDQQGNIYFYAITDGANVGVMKLNSEGEVAWKKKLKMRLGPYNSQSDMRPVAVKLVNGYLWALSNHYLFKIDPATGAVLKTTGVGSISDRWAPAQDVIRAGQHIMVPMGGGQLSFHILNVNDLSVIKSVKTPLTINPTSGFPTNTILDVADNRFFALSHYRLQSSMFPRGIIVEFDSDGKILNSALMKDGSDQFEVTRVHRDSDGNYAVSYNTSLEVATNIKTKDILVFDRNLKLIHKTSLPAALKGSAISYKAATAAIFDLQTANRVKVEWVDMTNPGCKVNIHASNIKLETLPFKAPEVTTDIKQFSSQMTFEASEDMSYTTEEVSVVQQSSLCGN